MGSGMVFWLYLFVVCNYTTQLLSVKPWTDKLFDLSNNIPEDDQDTLLVSPSQSKVRQEIVYYHNLFRTKVRQTASNMLLMSWHHLAAQQAQNYAEKCIYLHHNGDKERTVPSLGICGQNLYVSTTKTRWISVLKSWFDEYKYFTYGEHNPNLKVVSHYTQMVWATSHQVGCGVAHCSGGPWGHYYNYVCNYCPGGNIGGIVQYPYKPGKPCADCPNHCISDSLCTNSCPVKDYYSNCNNLVTFPNYCKQGTCNATCECGSTKLHRNYPWN